MTLPIDPHIMNAIYRSDFVSFFRKCFATLMPGAPLLMNWHIYALAYALAQVRCGKIKRPIINIPPRSPEIDDDISSASGLRFWGAIRANPSSMASFTPPTSRPSLPMTVVSF